MFSYSNNIALNLTNPKAARELYEKAFDMKFQSEGKEGIHLKSQNMNFWLDQAEAGSTKVPEAFFEFLVENSEEAKAKLTTLGFECLQTTLPNCYMMRDPMGVNWHLFQRKRGKGIVDTTGYNLTCIYVDEMEKSVKFYTEILGFEKVRDMTPGALFKVGSEAEGSFLYLEGGRKKTPRPETENTSENPMGSSCICLNAPSIKEAAAALKKIEVPFHRDYVEYAPTFAGFQILDPAGNIVEYAGKP